MHPAASESRLSQDEKPPHSLCPGSAVRGEGGLARVCVDAIGSIQMSVI